MKFSFRHTFIFLSVLALVLLSSGCANDAKKFAEISNGFAKSINQLGKESGITMTGFASDPDKKLFKIGIGIDRSIMTNERLKQVFQSYVTNAASFTSEHDPQKMLEPYNLQIDEIDKATNSSRLIAEKPSGTTVINWKNIDNSQVTTSESNPSSNTRDYLNAGYPKLEITNGTNKIIWDRGDANYTSKPGELIGNTNFGVDIEQALKTPVSVVKPESLIGFKADKVADLDKPTYKVRLVDSDKHLKLYPINQDSIVVPKAEGEYLFELQVNWGNENHQINYWFHIETQT